MTSAAATLSRSSSQEVLQHTARGPVAPPPRGGVEARLAVAPDGGVIVSRVGERGVDLAVAGLW